MVTSRLREALADANERNVSHVKLDTKFVEAILTAMQEQKGSYTTLKSKLDGMRRASQQVIDGLSVAQSEYDKELATRRDAQAEVARLKAQLHGQNARLTHFTADEKKRELQELLSKDLNSNLDGLQRDVSKLMVERDLTLAEVEELSASKRTGDAPEASLSRSLTTRLESLKSQYRRELEPLNEEREVLRRELTELKQARDAFLEEVTALNARNEELAELNRGTERQLEMMRNATLERPPKVPQKAPYALNSSLTSASGSPSPSQSFMSSVGSTSTISTMGTMVDGDDARFGKLTKADYVGDASNAPKARGKGFGWNTKKPMPQHQLAMVQERGTVVNGMGGGSERPRNNFEHTFQQISVLRVARCDYCNDKMWGSQLRCSNCSIAVHTRCVHMLQASCRPPQYQSEDNFDTGPLPPSLFGRDLIEQTQADARGQERDIPVIVEKCVNAVEKSAMDYEGIYRKSGGSSLSKSITQLFERGNYDSFDLEDTEVFNDISSITSVLKSYFRALPNPLLSHALHEQFIGAAVIKDVSTKMVVLADLVHQLPREHFYTLKFLMLHLHRVQAGQEENLMSARNLGVVFGPTLMRSSDIGREFADMAGKAMTIEWLIEHANVIFADQ
ncbi:RhoGAP-domain-containing protein [Auriculariales sp. MPI-PUGE-AT-0066]|nr:RhoGAP-domain-containing protein [Auriculariales sp. MPI-PUGE-AT-0066]